MLGHPFIEKNISKTFDYLTTNEMLDKLPHAVLDLLYFRIRKTLNPKFEWRRNPIRIYSLFKDYFNKINKYTSIVDKSILDIGSGKYNPLNLVTLFYLNGCKSCHSLDIDNFDHERGAESLYQLLLECNMFPEKFLISNMEETEYFKRIKKMDINSLNKYQTDGFLSSVPIKLFSGDINNVKLSEESFDIIYSHAVFEHLLQFDRSMETLYQIMSPRGIMVHVVDFRDHRAFFRPSKYHSWSFLEEDPNWTDNLTNRLRPNQMKKKIEDAGFKILDFVSTKDKMPTKCIKNLAEPYATMPKEELEIILGTFTIQKE